MITNNPARLCTPDEDGEQNWLIWQASPTDGRHNEPARVGDLKLFEPAAIHFLVTDRDGWWAAMRLCQLLQRRRSL
jgi:hypothetical protein